MPRPKGSKVVLCKCGSRVVAMPGTTAACPGCKRKHTIPKSDAKKAPAKKAPAKKVVKKGAKKVSKKK